MEGSSNKVLILGVSGWIAQYLVDSLQIDLPEISILGVYRSNKPLFNFHLEKIDNSGFSRINELIDEFRPTVVINMTRGETDIDYDLHTSLINTLNKKNIYYAYLSSSCATDALWDRPYDEMTRGNSRSDYGKFKAKCEKALIDKSNNYCAFRFTATHGYAANRLSRTEIFLRKLQSGKQISVTDGFYQNRTYISDLTHMMSVLIIKQAQGILHLGPMDQSNEYEFLSMLAAIFGYDKEQVIKEYSEQKTFCSAIPNNIFKYLDNSFQMQENVIFEKISHVPEFKKYFKVGQNKNLSKKACSCNNNSW